MLQLKNLMSFVIAITLVFSGSVCACADAPTKDDGSESNPHAHHQMQAALADAQDAKQDIGQNTNQNTGQKVTTDGDSLCSNQDCEDCTATVLGASPEQDGNLALLVKTGLDDVVWIASHSPALRPAPLLLARASPPPLRPLRASETPVRRADLLLQ